MKEKYDVVIIGAGIGGLVCGCYLAKSGLKVAMVEQHTTPGGCCASFRRKGYIFDVGVHYLGSCRNAGILNKIFEEIDIKDRLELLRGDLTDRIITPDKVLFYRSNAEDIRGEIVRNFPKEEKKINNFFTFLTNDFLTIFGKTRTLTFQQLLDAFFDDCKLKSVLSMPLVGNLGLHPQELSALVAVVLYKEFILDSGYYPKGGIQVLPDSLLRLFEELGGRAFFSSKVTKIITKNNKVAGVLINQDELIRTDVVVSNADATLTFEKMLDCFTKEAELVKTLAISPSAFVAYLGLNKDLSAIVPKHHITWNFTSYDLKNCFGEKIEDSFRPNFNSILYSFPSLIDSSLAPANKSIVRIFLGAQYVSSQIWKQTKQTLYEQLLSKAEILIPGISNFVETFETATPDSFYRFTLNREGALFGWAPLVSQVDTNIFSHQTSVENLYLAGHWTTNGIGQGGIAVVALSGKHAAKLILKNNKIQ